MTDRVAFLLIDVDGYCQSGVNQSLVMSATAEGFRARELGWACYFSDGAYIEHAAGSVFFHDEGLPALLVDTSVHITRGIHGLPVAPAPSDYPTGAVVTSSANLLRVVRALHDGVAAALGARVVFVHKGGHEGTWARRAVPGAVVLELGELGCPRVDVIHQQQTHQQQIQGNTADCGCHRVRKKKKGIVHCPQLELSLLGHWLATQ